MKIEVKKSTKLVNYNIALKFLERRVKDVINGKKPELLWILEHKPTFTAGTSYKENEILNKKIKLIKTSRGGKITYHGPGQIVAYFVLNLNNIFGIIDWSWGEVFYPCGLLTQGTSSKTPCTAQVWKNKKQ